MLSYRDLDIAVGGDLPPLGGEHNGRRPIHILSIGVALRSCRGVEAVLSKQH